MLRDAEVNLPDYALLLYKAENECHIHGEQARELLFGKDEGYYGENMERNLGSEDRIHYMQSQLRKNTKTPLKK